MANDRFGARRRPPATAGTLTNHLSGRVNPLTSALLVFPLFVGYQAGILASRGQNGVDFITRGLVELCARSLENYLLLLGGIVLVYAAVLVLLRRRGRFSPRAFGPVLLESSFYALSMGSLIVFVMHRVIGVAPSLALAQSTALVDILVISAGAGLHEELVFRVGGMGVLAWLLAGLIGRKQAWLAALLLSSVAFSLAHHIGPAGEAFSFAAFVYRVLAGVFFALVYRVRGFAVAAWTHALYDVYVLCLR
ncbi:MAG: CPBP family intramembrane metalloprotease [Myxococcales bacterium FL481]|nr:MAG: CPBP family intramembrane metalloprotease [Myxococcales bacterium FL481]